jgi:Phage integrase family
VTRRSQIPALRWNDIDRDRGALRPVQSLEQTRTGLRVNNTKSSRTRALPFQLSQLRCFAAANMNTLKNYSRWASGKQARRPACCRTDSEPRSRAGSLIQFMLLQDQMKDLPRVRFHDIRHSHATPSLADGAHPKVAQVRLGHSTIATTTDLYSHVADTIKPTPRRGQMPRFAPPKPDSKGRREFGGTLTNCRRNSKPLLVPRSAAKPSERRRGAALHGRSWPRCACWFDPCRPIARSHRRHLAGTTSE